MSYRKPLDEREHALEEAFFHKREVALLETLRASRDRDSTREALAKVLGLRQPSLLDALLDLGVTPESGAALSLLPLVLVAWADGTIAKREREAILEAAHQHGIERGGATARLLESWLYERPGKKLAALWEDCIVGRSAQLDAVARAKLAAGVIDEARSVARAASNNLGLGSSISKREREELARLAAVLGRAHEPDA